MAKFIIWSKEQNEAFQAWLAGRPDDIKAMIASHPADELYLKKTINKRVRLVSYDNDGTVTVYVDPEYNPESPLARLNAVRVYGVKLDDLIPTDLPSGVKPKIGAMGADDA